MKRIIAFLSALCLLAGLWGCAADTEPLRDPVIFYYPKASVSFTGSDSVISSELREAQGHQNDTAYLMSAYLSGPQSDGLEQIFPAGTRLISLKTYGSKTRLILTDEFAQLTGVDLTLACACLSMTVMELIGTESVEIRAATMQLDTARSITMDRSSLLLLDDSDSLTGQNTEESS